MQSESVSARQTALISDAHAASSDDDSTQLQSSELQVAGHSSVSPPMKCEESCANSRSDRTLCSLLMTRLFRDRKSGGTDGTAAAVDRAPAN